MHHVTFLYYSFISVSAYSPNSSEKSEGTALATINLSVLRVLMLIMRSVVPQRWGRKYIMPGLPNGVLFLFGGSRYGFDSFAMSASSFRKILIKQNLIQSNKAGSLGSNFPNRPCLVKMISTNLVCLQQILFSRTQYVD